MRIQLT